MVVADSTGVLSTQAIPTGTVTGTGTTNYVSKWTSSSAIGNSQIFDNGTDVGINTATPQGKLESKTATVFAGNAAYAKKAFVANIPYSTTDITSSLLAGFDGGIHGVDIGYAYDSTGGYYLAFATNNDTSGSPIERMRINKLGQVGINTQTLDNSQFSVYTGTGASFRVANNGANRVEIGNYTAADGYRQLDIVGSTIAFATGTAGGGSAPERGRFTTDGWLQVSNNGSYQGSEMHQLSSNQANNLAVFRNTHGATPYGPYVNFSGVAPNNRTSYFFAGDDTVGRKFTIWSDGGATFGNKVQINSTDTDGMLNIRTASAVGYSPNIYMGVSANIRLLPSGTAVTGTTTGISLGVGGSAEVYIGAVQQANTYADLVFQSYSPGAVYSEKMRLNNSGNLGLGVTPSAWADYKVLQLGGGSISSYVDNRYFEVNQNSFWDGSYKYVNTGFSSRYMQYLGGHQWFNAPSGTAGNAISFTQAMTLNASGNLSVGNTNDTYKLDVTGTGRFTGAVIFSDKVGLGGTSTYTQFNIATGNDTQMALGTTSTAQTVGIFFADGPSTNTSNYKWEYGKDNSNNYFIYSYAVGANVFTLALSDGAAWFRSSVTATSFFESSDSRLKTLIQDNYQTKGIASITPKLYTKNGKVELGYYAQDFVGILDSAVSKGSDDMLSLSYREVLVAKVYALEQRIKELENN
jgi:hypothetical protein